MANTATSVEFSYGNLRTIRTKARVSVTEPGHADLTIRVSLGEDYEAASAFLAYIQEAGHGISFTITEIQRRIPDEDHGAE